MGSGTHRVGWTRALLVAALVAGVACSSNDDPAQPAPHGPDNGLVEVDPSSIPLGENKPAQGGSSAQGGGSATGGASPGSSNPIGKPCETSADCAAGLTCHMDPDYISHKQCTTYCDSEDPCVAINKDSFCIGANVCVDACETDADCGPKTVCGSSGWCERTGPGSGVPYCGGFPTPCGLLTGFDCTGAFGCSDDSECGGVASSCYSQFSSFACTSQDGCFWSSSSDDCSGSAHSCITYSFDFQCETQDGCYWTPRCTGTPRECEEMPVTLCSNQPGCSMRTD